MVIEKLSLLVTEELSCIMLGQEKQVNFYTLALGLISWCFFTSFLQVFLQVFFPSFLVAFQASPQNYMAILSSMGMLEFSYTCETFI